MDITQEQFDELVSRIDSLEARENALEREMKAFHEYRSGDLDESELAAEYGTELAAKIVGEFEIEKDQIVDIIESHMSNA